MSHPEGRNTQLPSPILDQNALEELRNWARGAMETPLGPPRDPSFFLQSYEKLSDFKNTIENVEDTARSLWMDVIKARAVMAPIRRLPHEILGKIFWLTGGHARCHRASCSRKPEWKFDPTYQNHGLEQQNAATLRSIMLVSKRWHDVAISTPNIWARVVLCKFCRLPGTKKGLEIQVKRAGDLALDVHLYGSDAKLLPHLLQISLMGGPRWESLTCFVESPPSPALMKHNSLKDLKSLYFNSSFWSAWPFTENQQDLLQLPKLEHLGVVNIAHLPLFDAPLQTCTFTVLRSTGPRIQQQLLLLPHLRRLSIRRCFIAHSHPIDTTIPLYLPKLLSFSYVDVLADGDNGDGPLLLFCYLLQNMTHVKDLEFSEVDGGMSLPDILDYFDRQLPLMLSTHQLTYISPQIFKNDTLDLLAAFPNLTSLALKQREVKFDSWLEIDGILHALIAPEVGREFKSLKSLTLRWLPLDMSTLRKVSWARSSFPNGALKDSNSSGWEICLVTLEGCYAKSTHLTHRIPDIRNASWRDLSLLVQQMSDETRDWTAMI